LAALRSNGRALADEQLQQELESVQQLEKAITDQEKAVRKLGDKGVKADDILDPEQVKLSAALSEAAYGRYLDTISELDRQTTAKLLDLQKDSDQKELGQLQLKFDNELRIARDAHNDQLVEALSFARKQQVAALKQQQDIARIQNEQRLTEANLRNATPVVTSIGTDVTADQSGSQEVEGAAKRNTLLHLLADRSVDIEVVRQKRLLQAQINGNNKILARIEDDFSEQGIELRQNLVDANEAAYPQFNKLGEKSGF